MAWAGASRSAARSSKRTADVSGRRRTTGPARASPSPYPSPRSPVAGFLRQPSSLATLKRQSPRLASRLLVNLAARRSLMRAHFLAVALGAHVIAVSSCFGQAPPNATEPGAAGLALTNLPAKGGAKLTVTSPAFKPGGDIPFENTQYRGNVFPGLSWSAGPEGTKSYVVIMQDGDAMVRGAPLLHWTMVNIPATVTKLDSGM